MGHVNTSPTRADLFTYTHEGPIREDDQRIHGMNLLTGREPGHSTPARRLQARRRALVCRRRDPGLSLPQALGRRHAFRLHSL